VGLDADGAIARCALPDARTKAKATQETKEVQRPVLDWDKSTKES